MKIEFYQKRHQDQIINFITQKKLQNKIEWWEWKYQNRSKEDILLALDKEENILAGYYAFLSWDLQFSSKIIKAVQSVDTLVNSDYRRKGIFTTLASKAIEQQKTAGMEFAWGFTNMKEPAFKGFINKVGWLDIGQQLDFYFPLKSHQFSKKIFKNRIFAVLSTIALKLLKLWKMKNRYTLFASNFLITEEWKPSEFLKSWIRIQDTNILHIHRDLDYFEWRFKSHPNAIYRPLIICTEENGFLGYAIISIVDDVAIIAEI
ncbi:MAG: GNAT family N-acetyltransferase, partial [Candidatus Heimdallarchaeaceae archaeon]